MGKRIRIITLFLIFCLVCVSAYAVQTNSTGNIGVSFARNNMIPSIKYYTESSLSENSLIDIDSMEEPLLLNEGDKIYVEYNNPKSSFYEFKGFRLYSYDEKGNRTDDEPLVLDNKEFITIPLELYYNQLSIEPYGEFRERKITFSDICDGDELDNTWFIGDEKYTSEYAEINAMSPYSVSFKYDPAVFYLVACNPENRIISAGSGSVIFFEENPISHTNSNIISDYSVELKPYTHLEFIGVNLITNSRIKRISTENEDIAINKLPEYSFKIGDTITIETGKDWVLSAVGAVIKLSAITEDSRIYTVTIVDSGDYNIELSLSETDTYTVQFELPEIPEGELAPSIELSFGSENLDNYNDLLKQDSINLEENSLLYLRIRNAAPSRNRLFITLVFEDGQSEKIEIRNNEFQRQFRFGADNPNLQQINLNIEYGIYFSAAKNDPTLLVRYYREGASEIVSGEFLPDGTDVRILVQNCPMDRELKYSTNVQKDTKSPNSAILKITKDITISDFEVNTVELQGFWFDPDEFSTKEHGKVCFIVNNVEIASRVFLKNGTEIKYQEQSSDDGYHLVPDTIVVNGDFTEQELIKIEFSKDAPIKLYLNQPEFGGTITYLDSNKQKIMAHEIYAKEGDVIHYELNPFNGYSPKDSRNAGSYTVTAAKVQSLPSDLEVFSESPEHRPDLVIDIHNAPVGLTLYDATRNIRLENARAGVDLKPKDSTNVGLSEESSGILGRNKYKVCVIHDILTYEPAFFELQGISYISGNQAMRIIRRDDFMDGSSVDTKTYITENAFDYELDFDYSVDPNRIYKEIRLTFEVVSGHFYVEKKIDNAKISVFVDGIELAENQFIEPESSVVVKIIPELGYYISGKDVEENIYSKTMKYSEYIDEIDSIVKDHPIIKYVSMYLPSSDEYGSYSYRYNDKNLSSDAPYSEFKIGDKLEIDFSANEGIEINRRIPLILSKKEISTDIEISESMDGQELCFEMLDIGLEENK